MIIKQEQSLSVYSVNQKVTNKDKAFKFMMGIIKGKKKTGWKLDPNEHTNFLQNMKKIQKIGWRSPQQLPPHGKLSTEKIPINQSQNIIERPSNVSISSCRRGRGRPRKRKRSERLTDSEEESETEII